MTFPSPHPPTGDIVTLKARLTFCIEQERRIRLRKEHPLKTVVCIRGARGSPPGRPWPWRWSQSLCVQASIIWMMRSILHWDKTPHDRGSHGLEILSTHDSDRADWHISQTS